MCLCCYTNITHICIYKYIDKPISMILKVLPILLFFHCLQLLITLKSWKPGVLGLHTLSQVIFQAWNLNPCWLSYCEVQMRSYRRFSHIKVNRGQESCSLVLLYTVTEAVPSLLLNSIFSYRFPFLSSLFLSHFWLCVCGQKLGRH